MPVAHRCHVLLTRYTAPTSDSKTPNSKSTTAATVMNGACLQAPFAAAAQALCSGVYRRRRSHSKPDEPRLAVPVADRPADALAAIAAVRCSVPVAER